MMSPLSTEEGMILVGTARQAITHHLDGKNFDPTDRADSELSIRRGVFVTLFDKLMSRGLRGCIGNPFPKTSLLNETVRCAVEAATMDPRFAPLRQDEFLRGIVVEGTVLSPLEHIMVKSPLDLPLNIKVGRDGLFVDGVGTRGLLLPQVAVDEGFDEEEFLNEDYLKRSGFTYFSAIPLSFRTRMDGTIDPKMTMSQNGVTVGLGISYVS